MVKLMAFILLSTVVSLQSLAPSSAEESGAKPGTEQPDKKKKYRSFEKAAPSTSTRSLQSPPASAPSPSRGDGGKPEDTIGGLPGQKPGEVEKQP